MAAYSDFRRNSPVACWNVSFKGDYTHYIALADGANFKNFPGNIASGQHAMDYLFKSMVVCARKYTAKDFYLNEYVHAVDRPIRHCLYLDIDIPSFMAISDIEWALSELVDGDVALKVSHNEESGKVHIVTNILIDSSEQKQITRYLGHYLFDFMSDYTKEQWEKGFDDKACGLRSIYSIKIADGIKSRARYLPVGEAEPKSDEEFADLLWKYSIYNISNTVNLTEAARDQISSYVVESRRVHAASADEEFINRSQTLPIFGRNYKVDQKLIDNFVQCLGMEWKNAKRWWVVLMAVRNASQFIADFDPKYFLADWSAGGEGFNLDDNFKRFAGFAPVPEQFAHALAFLRGAACKSNYRQVRRLLFPTPAIMDPECKTYFIDYEKIPQCPREDAGHREKYLRAIHEFIHEAVGLVINGGQSLWVTKNMFEGEIEYTMVRCNSQQAKNFDDIHFVIDWEEGNPVTTSLAKQLQVLRRDISYTRMDFIPYIRAQGWENTERVFNQFTRLVSDHEYVLRSQAEYETDLKDILYHMREVLCAGDEPSYQYLLHWLAHIVQRPDQKIGVCCLVRSQEGAGKTSFWEWFGKHVLGRKYYLPARMDRVVKKFNSITANNLFTVFEETKNGEGMKNHEELKQMITDEWQVIEPKGIDSYKTRSYTNYVILTNEHYPVKLTANDRRFFCLEADNKHKSDRAYWLKLLAQFKEGGAAMGALLFEYLHTFDLSSWNSRPVETTLRRDLKMNSLPFSIQFLIDVVRGNVREITWGKEPIRIHTETFYGFFKNWETESDVKIKTSQMGFSKSINEVQKSDRFELTFAGKKKRAMGFIYTREALIKNLQTYLNDPGFTVDIETEAEAVLTDEDLLQI